MTHVLYCLCNIFLYIEFRDQDFNIEKYRSVCYTLLSPLFEDEEMRNEELLNALRVTVREEVNVAVNASEQRMTEQIKAGEQRIGERLDKIEMRLDRVEARLDHVETRLGHVESRLDRVEVRLDRVEMRLNKVEGMVAPMAEHLKLLKVGQREMLNDFMQAHAEFLNVKNDQKNDLVQALNILDLVTIKINDLERSQYNLENKVEQNIKGFWNDMQRLVAAYPDFTKDFNRIIKDVQTQLEIHIYTPVDETHPPHSGSAA
jgi:archaellum component FlaC